MYIFHWISEQYSSYYNINKDVSPPKFTNFTILPMSIGFKPLFITFDSRGLYQLLKRIKNLIPPRIKKIDPDLVFNYKKFQTNRIPGKLILTDGISVCLLYTKEFNPSKLDNFERQEKLISDCKNIENPKIIGLDPGRNSPFVVSEYIENFTEKKFINRNLSNKTFRHYSGNDKNWKRTSNYQKSNPVINEIIKTIPFHNTTNINILSKYINFIIPNLSLLYTHFNKKNFKSWRFTSHSKRKKALSKAAHIALGWESNSKGKTIIPSKEERDNIIVGFGNAKFNPSSKWLPPSPNASIRKAIENCGVKVIYVDEFNTSKKCCICGKELLKVKSRLNTEETLLWSVRRCDNNECRIGNNKERGFWNRDINASFNIAKCLNNKLKDKERPLELKRSQPSKEERPD